MLDFIIPDQLAMVTLAVAYLLCICTCFMCITHRLAFKDYTRKKQLGIVVIYGISFWVVHPLILLSERTVTLTETTILLMVLTVPLTCAALWVALAMGAKIEISSIQFLLGSFIIGTLIFTLDVTLYMLTFADTLDINGLILTYSYLLVGCIAGAVLRFLLILNNETELDEIKKWHFAGAVTIGIALASIPNVIKASLTVGKELTNLTLTFDSIFFALLINIVALIVLILVPDLLGDNQRKKTKLALLTNRAEYHSLFFNHPDAVFAIDQEERFIRMNETARQTLNQTEATLPPSLALKDVLKSRTYVKVKSYLKQAFDGIGSEFHLYTADDRYFQVTLLPLEFEGQTAAYAILKDQTDPKKYQEQIQHFAFHDDLTGLKNRRGFFVELEEINHPFSIVMIDFDHFKRINDIYGHDYGDLLLKELARRMKHRFLRPFSIARIGGDEFAMIYSGEDEEALVNACRKFLDDFSEPIQVGGRLCYMTPSIGFAHSIADEKPAAIVSYADYAMFQSKNNGRNQIQLFKPEMKERLERKKVLEKGLPHAILNDELFLVYQPILNTVSARIEAVEALVRWEHPKLGLISPGEFIPTAEDIGEIAHLEEWVVTTACEEVKKWNESLAEPVRLSVNLSMKHIEQTDIHLFVKDRLTQTGFSPEWMTIELTETTLMRREKETVKSIEKLKEMGVAVYLDDFGTGYSSLNYIMRLPLDGVKLDRLFLQKMKQDNEHYTLVHSLITMKHKLGLEVVAEGVETKDHLHMLEKMGCEKIQGYYIAKPLHHQVCLNMVKSGILPAAEIV
ncbi:putative bifunctional diguanylate cyclase/phosphodiesterase [Alteribacter keqinensis]|uniref:Phosphodiesterase n=1 Tax=Alteribacter keqinensis TaxID=2483800 RepID=A0A3M7TM86_9BACI|nr:GGDEF domain-containing phosphodiesterase [Alteribacter keqinensis]RNA66300.1 phosphodiesterase [Alteribacter keqinensis]